MINKLVDTTTSFGRAEKELNFDADWMRFFRGGKYDLKAIKTIDSFAVAKKFNLKGIVFGNYITQEERHFYLYKVSKQMECLSKLRGNTNLGKGILTLAIGSHGVGGNVNAHFSPSQDLINLARGNKGDYKKFMKGENSFVHEYGHFLDFQQGRIKDKKLRANFACENVDPKWPNKNTRLFSDPISAIVEDKSYMDELDTPYYRSRIEILARLFEASITHYVHEHVKTYTAYFDRTYKEKVYYPKAKILKLGYDKQMIKLLKL